MVKEQQQSRGSDTAQRVALLGGTFDPPHVGHLVVARHIQHALQLDAVWFVVANDPWQKTTTRSIAPASVRLEMTQAAVAELLIDSTESALMYNVSDIEIRRGGPSYTAQTLESLRITHPTTEFLVAIGADAAAGLPTWHEAKKLKDQTTFIVVNRPGDHAAPPPSWSILPVPIPALDLSSSELRSMVSAGQPLLPLTARAVVEIIERHQLYK